MPMVNAVGLLANHVVPWFVFLDPICFQVSRCLVAVSTKPAILLRIFVGARVSLGFDLILESATGRFANVDDFVVGIDEHIDPCLVRCLVDVVRVVEGIR